MKNIAQNVAQSIVIKTLTVEKVPNPKCEFLLQ
jgi:hypothetical protein